jgi:ABC-type glycerol-3-phosphate transport system substrate-binding protein
MNRVKKFFVLSLISLPIIFNLSCSHQKNSDSKTTIVFWHSFVGSTIPALKEIIQKFETEHPDIHIEAQYVPTGDALVQKLITSIQSNTAPDISWIHADFLDKLVEANAIYPMEKFIKGNDGLSADEISDFFPQLLNEFTYKETLYALPMEATVLALIYNKDHFKAAGLNPNKPPSNWQELKDYASKLTIDKNKDGKFEQYGFYVPALPSSGFLSIWEVLQWSPFLWQAGGKIIDSSQKKVLFNGDAGVEALTLWKNIFDQEKFVNFTLTHDIGFTSGNLSMIMDGPWDLPTFRKIKNFNWGVAPLPQGPIKKATYIAGESLVIFKQSKNPEAAWTFVKWVTQPEIQAMFSKLSGYLPVRKLVLNRSDYREFLKGDNAMQAFVDQIKIAEQRPTIEKYFININQYIAAAIENTLIGNKSAKSSLDEAANKCNSLLQNADN